jgi:hypothetical protein
MHSHVKWPCANAPAFVREPDSTRLSPAPRFGWSAALHRLPANPMNKLFSYKVLIPYTKFSNPKHSIDLTNRCFHCRT